MVCIPDEKNTTLKKHETIIHEQSKIHVTIKNDVLRI